MIILNVSSFGQKASSDFVFTISTNQTGSSGDSSYIVYIDSSFSYNYDIDWDNDGTFDALGVTDSLLINYPDTGTYTIRIKGVFPSIKFGQGSGAQRTDRFKLLSIDQWGDQNWQSLDFAFYNCYNLTRLAQDTIDLSGVSSLESMFHLTEITDGVSHWDVSNITNMRGLFRNAFFFDDSIGIWNVSSVTDMSKMFSNASNFDQDLNGWNVSNVLDMSEMFNNAINFDHDVNNWNVSSVMNMSSMFASANSFNQPLSNWDVSSVTDFSLMFASASRFDQPLANWDVSSAIDMHGMFFGALSFDQALNSWDVSSVTDMTSLFQGASSFDQPLNNWNTSNVVSMAGMFAFDTSFNQSLNSWQIDSVRNLSFMFYRAKKFNQPVDSWNTRNVINMESTFREASSFDQILHRWNYSSCTDMRRFLNLSGLSTANYDSLLIHLDQNYQALGPIDLGALGMKFCNAAIERASLATNFWNIFGDRLDCQTVGIEEAVKSSFIIYPNPASLFLHFQEAPLGERIQIVSPQGQVLEDEVILKKNFSKDISTFENGIYFVRIGERVEKLVIQK